MEADVNFQPVEIKKNYEVQDGCHNCVHCFVYYEWEEDDKAFCNINGDRPVPCGSSAMNEHFSVFSTNKRANPEREISDWRHWAEEHEVVFCGKCDSWRYGQFCPFD